jgi:quinoprotein glucose dehydrogenase
MGVLLALRRLGDPEVARFLKDSDLRLVLEAARAINDVPIAGAMAQFAAMPIASTTPLPLMRRVFNANLRVGGAEQAAALAEAAGRSDLPSSMRVLALGMLGEWARPGGRDAVMGLWRPIAPRPAGPAADALRPRLLAILTSSPESVQNAAALAAAALGIKDAGPHLVALATDRSQTDRVRAAALKALVQLDDPRCVDVARKAADLPGAGTRTEALQILAKADPAAAISVLQKRIESGSTAERQGAIGVLGSMGGESAVRELAGWLDRLVAGGVPPEIQLDLVQAAAGRPEPELKKALERYEASKPKADPLAPYREALAGGNARRGRSIFTESEAIACLRCHKVRSLSGEGQGGEVGPELSGIGARQDRRYILESIVNPNKQIAQGFESVVLATSDGKVVTGVLRGEDDKEVRLITAEGQLVNVPKDTIEERQRGPSAMPNDLVQKISKAELRDLVEFLASQKTQLKKP